MAEIAVKAVLAVADLERKDVQFDLIKIEVKLNIKAVKSWWRIEGYLPYKWNCFRKRIFSSTNAKNSGESQNSHFDLPI